jgi:hypothetical protein
LGQVLLTLYDQQTWDEQLYKRTKADNRIGFSKANAARLGRMAETLLVGRNLPSADLVYCRETLRNGLPRLAKYRGQILSLLGHQELQETGKVRQ